MWFANLLLFSLEHSVCNVIWMIVCILLLLHMRESVAELQNFCFKCCSGSRTLLSMFLLTEASNIFTVIFCLVNQFYAWTFFQGEWWHHPIHLWVIVLDLWKRNIHLLSNILSQVTYVEGTFSSNIHNTQSPPNLLLHCETTVINIHRIALSRPSVSSSSTCYNCSPSSYFNCCFHTLIPKTFSCSCSWSHFLQLEVAIFIFLFLPILMTQFVHSSAKLFLYNYLVDDASGVITMERCRLGCKSSFSLSPLISLCFVVCYTEKDMAGSLFMRLPEWSESQITPSDKLSWIFCREPVLWCGSQFAILNLTCGAWFPAQWGSTRTTSSNPSPCTFSWCCWYRGPTTASGCQSLRVCTSCGTR